MDNKLIERALFDSATEVFEKMLFLEIKPDTGNELLPIHREISGRISFEGIFKGVVRLDCSCSLAKELTVSFLGIDPDDADTTKVDDNIKELVNMICGNMFCKLDEDRSLAKLGIPEVVREAIVPINLSGMKWVASYIFSCPALRDIHGKEEKFGVFLFEQAKDEIN